MYISALAKALQSELGAPVPWDAVTNIAERLIREQIGEAAGSEPRRAWPAGT